MSRREPSPYLIVFSLWLLVFSASSQIMVISPILPQIGVELSIADTLLGRAPRRRGGPLVRAGRVASGEEVVLFVAPEHEPALLDVRRQLPVNGQRGRATGGFGSARPSGGLGRISNCVTRFAPCRVAVPMQSDPVCQAACAVFAEVSDGFVSDGQSDPDAFRLLGAVLPSLVPRALEQVDAGVDILDESIKAAKA